MFEIRVPDLKRLEQEVVEYEKVPIETGKILFYGDSGFTRWKSAFGHRPMEEDLLGKDGKPAVINHGFGTSTAEEQLYYYDRMIKPWKPKALVLMTYCNDWDCGYSPEEVLYLQARLMEYARKDMPGIRFYLCDARPLTIWLDSRVWTAWESYYTQYNRLLAQYCAAHDDCALVRHGDSPLLFNSPEDVGDYKKIRTDIFVEDQVHYNQTGYDLYGEFFRQALDDIL